MKFLHNTNRVEAFSDAVFAFAATLLVVSINDDESTSVLKIDLAKFIGFVVSFFVLILLWKVHYNFFRRTQYLDNWIIAINSILLFLVLYFIFPIKSIVDSLLGEQSINSYGELASLFQLYSFGILTIFSCISLMYLRAYRHSKKVENSIELLFYVRHFAIFIVVSLVSILLSTFGIWMEIGFPGWIYFLLGPLCYFHAVWFNKNIRNKLS